MLNKISFTNIDPKFIINRENSLVPPGRLPNFLIDTSLADHIKKDTANSIYTILFNEIMNFASSSSQIYTDASKANTGVGIFII